MRNRSIALVVRDKAILMIQTFRRNSYIWELPGGGNELSERDRVFLWSCGLLEVEGYFDFVLSWGDAISYPVG